MPPRARASVRVFAFPRAPLIDVVFLSARVRCLLARSLARLIFRSDLMLNAFH